MSKIVKDMESMSRRIQQYEAHQQLRGRIKGYTMSMKLLSELKSSALKDRHWKKIVKLIGVSHISMMQLTLGDLLDARPKSREKDLKDIMVQAQGEMGLEVFLGEVREFWSAFEVDLVTYRKKCRLIRGWDEMFSKLDDNLTSLSSMKQSPYFRVFEDEAMAWEKKLVRIRSVFDIWIDVQRRWV